MLISVLIEGCTLLLIRYCQGKKGLVALASVATKTSKKPLKSTKFCAGITRQAMVDTDNHDGSLENVEDERCRALYL